MSIDLLEFEESKRNRIFFLFNSHQIKKTKINKVYIVFTQYFEQADRHVSAEIKQALDKNNFTVEEAEYVILLLRL